MSVGGKRFESVDKKGERERTDDELLDSELFHGVGWGRLLLGLNGNVQCASNGGRLAGKNLPWRSSSQRYLVAVREYVGLAFAACGPLSECG